MLDDADIIDTPDTEKAYDFDAPFQEKIVALTLRDTGFLVRTNGLIDSAYFENDADRFLAEMSLDYFKKYKKAADGKLLTTILKDAFAKKVISKEAKEEIVKKLIALRTADLSDRDFVMDKCADFAKRRAVEKAMIASIGAMEKNDFATIEKLMRSSFLVGSTSEGNEYDYWEQAEARTNKRNAIIAGLITPDGVTSGYAELDQCLDPHLGWGRRELSVIMGPPKAGKSMALGDFAKNASLAGHNVFFASCEVSAEIISNRTDANLARIAMKTLKTAGKPDEALALIQAASKDAGLYKMREYASGTLRPSELRRVLERYRAQGITFELIVVDYADIMAPDIRSDETRENLRTIYLDLRAIAFEYNAAVLTATQTNREGIKAAVAKMGDVAEDINKIRTADCVISINSTEDERAKGEARLFFAALRNAESEFSLRIQQDRSQMAFIRRIIGRE